MLIDKKQKRDTYWSQMINDILSSLQSPLVHCYAGLFTFSLLILIFNGIYFSLKSFHISKKIISCKNIFVENDWYQMLSLQLFSKSLSSPNVTFNIPKEKKQLFGKDLDYLLDSINVLVIASMVISWKESQRIVAIWYKLTY